MTRRTRAVVTGFVACTAAIGACGSNAGVSGASTSAAQSIVTPAQARAAVMNYDTVSITAEDSCNATLNDTVESGALATIDDAEAVRPPACTPTSTPLASPSIGTVVIPAGTSYPTAFLRITTLNNGLNHAPVTNLWVMESSAAGAPWKAPAQIALYAQSVPRFSSDAHGFAPAALDASARGFALTPAATCAAAADYFNAGYSGGALTTPMTAVPTISRSISAARSADQASLSSGINQSAQRTWACADTVFSERTKDGDALVVFTLSGTVAWELTPGRTTVIGSDHKDIAGQLQPLMAPGTYTVMQRTDLTLLAALVPKGGSTASPQLIGEYEGVVTETGT